MLASVFLFSYPSSKLDFQRLMNFSTARYLLKHWVFISIYRLKASIIYCTSSFMLHKYFTIVACMLTHINWCTYCWELACRVNEGRNFETVDQQSISEMVNQQSISETADQQSISHGDTVKIYSTKLIWRLKTWLLLLYKLRTRDAMLS